MSPQSDMEAVLARPVEAACRETSRRRVAFPASLSACAVYGKTQFHFSWSRS